MRPIKFRAWDTKKNKMWPAEEMGADELTINPDGRGFVNVNSTSPRLSHYATHLIPLQFTGLHDRNGKEIYEEDFYRDIDDRVYRIEWGNTTFRFFAVTLEPPIILIGIDSLKPGEVIGNIYENPELLKVST